MADWDEEDFEPEPVGTEPVTDKWDGEDEDDDVKDAWDAESDEENKIASSTGEVKKKKSVKERILEKQEAKRAALEAASKAAEEAAKKMTPEELDILKQRQKLEEEENEIMMVKEMAGLEVSPLTGIDAMKPVTAEEFAQFSEALKNKILQFQSSPYFTTFLEGLFRDSSTTLPGEEIKKMSTTLGALATAKIKLEKTTKGKGKKKKPTITKVRDDDELEVVNDQYDDLDDFM